MNDELVPADKEPWVDDSGVRHNLFVPQTSTLVGSPTDLPADQLSKRISLWSIINMEIDRREAPAGESSSTGAPSLYTWLIGFDGAKNFASFGQLGKDLTDQAATIGYFLRFRSSIADTQGLQQCVDAIRDIRLLGLTEAKRGLQDAAARTIDDLIRANRVSGPERLLEADIWLRYAMLLSYYQDKNNILDSRNGLESKLSILPHPISGAHLRFPPYTPPVSRPGRRCQATHRSPD